MKKLLTFASVLSVFALLACGDDTTETKNEACASYMGTTVATCAEVTGQNFTDASCLAAAKANDEDFDENKSTVKAMASCPSSYKGKCKMSSDTTMYVYDDMSAAFLALFCAAK